MPDLLKELEKCRQRWLKAKKRGDKNLMRLWEKVGKKLKEQLNGKK